MRKKRKLNKHNSRLVSFYKKVTMGEKRKSNNYYSRLASSFSEITKFFKKHGREPGNKCDVDEFKLYTRLGGIRNNPNAVIVLKDYDVYRLLSGNKE